MLVAPALAQRARSNPGFHRYKVGDIEVTALYDGIWEKPHDPAFIKNASVEETKEALVKAAMTPEFVSIPLTVVVLNIGGKYVMIDSGSGGQWKPTAGRMPSNMQASVSIAKISTILISTSTDQFSAQGKATNKAGIQRRARSRREETMVDRPGAREVPEARKALGTRLRRYFRLETISARRRRIAWLP